MRRPSRVAHRAPAGVPADRVTWRHSPGTASQTLLLRLDMAVWSRASVLKLVGLFGTPRLHKVWAPCRKALNVRRQSKSGPTSRGRNERNCSQHRPDDFIIQPRRHDEPIDERDAYGTGDDRKSTIVSWSQFQRERMPRPGPRRICQTSTRRAQRARISRAASTRVTFWLALRVRIRRHSRIRNICAGA